jgi:hypothetical protein
MSANDVNATYGGTWVLMKWGSNEAYHPVYISEAGHNDDGEVVVHGTDAGSGRGVTLKLYGDDVSVKWEHPEMGFVNSSNHVFHHQRIMARQWKRGLRRSQIETAVYGNQMSRLRGIVRECEFNETPHILQVFNPVYLSFEAAERAVKGGERYACAFSRDFAIAAHPSYRAPILKYKRWTVGVVDDGEFVLNNTCRHLSDQLNKVIVR